MAHDPDTIVELVSERGQRKLGHKNYLYVCDSLDGRLRFWRFEKFQWCKARLHVRGNRVVTEISTHTCKAALGPARIETLQVRVCVK